MKIIWKSCVDKAKLAVMLTFEKISSGVSFQEVAEMYNAVLVNADVNVYLSPENEEFAELMKGFQRATDTASFASDLLSSVTASITQSDSGESLGGWSSSVFSSMGPELVYLCHESGVLKVNADVNVYLSPENEEFAELMKGFQRATDTASFASDLLSSVTASITQSDSGESLGGWSSSSLTDDPDEVDIDVEIDKALQEGHAFDEASAECAEEQDPLLPKATTEENTRKPKQRLTLKEVAKEVLHEVSLIFSEGDKE
ncbi:unnamed protein product [Haemonchus placei]|uniref:Alpha-and gamma-adaptin-binding protein p34 n=1 Tax=Haemonchus placei TaxID=6290 RepID=A0A0N4WRS1_HAEPC|nr:unnamed protein product [Haemonchus placei]